MGGPPCAGINGLLVNILTGAMYQGVTIVSIFVELHYTCEGYKMTLTPV